MRVFLDTNVLASALGTRGLCADILREIIARHVLIVSEPLMIELKRILPKKFKIPPALADEMLEFLKQDLIDADDNHPLKINIKDKDDIVILSSASHRHTDIFITGDKEVLSLGFIGNMKILSPRTFWDKRINLKGA